MFGRKLPFWGPKFPLNFEKIETKNLMSQGKQLQPLMKAAHRQQVVPLSLLFLAQEITHLPQLSHHSLFSPSAAYTCGKENQQQISEDFENLFHQRNNGRFFPTKKKKTPCWSSKTTTSSHLAFRRSISSWSVWRFGSPKNGLPKRWHQNVHFERAAWLPCR